MTSLILTHALVSTPVLEGAIVVGRIEPLARYDNVESGVSVRERGRCCIHAAYRTVEAFDDDASHRRWNTFEGIDQCPDDILVELLEER